MIRFHNFGPVLSATMLLVSCFPASDCSNEILQDVPSPDGRRHAVVFVVNCGATTDFSTQVSVLTKAWTVNDRGNVLVIDSDHGKADATGPAGGLNVTVRWLDKRTLEVRYDGRARVFTHETRHDDTDIRYVADTTSPATH